MVQRTKVVWPANEKTTKCRPRTGQLVEWRKKIACWRVGPALYLSVVFSWQLDEARALALGHSGPVIAGGPAIVMAGEVDWADTPDTCPFNTLAIHNPLATFTTRGCPRGCKFCAVPHIEGQFQELSQWKPAPIVCDNNILASSRKHFERVIELLMAFPWVDFNQGLDARLFTPWHADQLARLRSVKIRFSLDRTSEAGHTKQAIDIAKTAGFQGRDRFGVYVLIGYKDSPEDALHRLELVRSWGIRPNPMRYQPLNAKRKNDYVAPGWTDAELKKMARYYSRLRYTERIPYEDFDISR